ncbi:uncharacterized protein LOC132713085 isoform X1 [Ruditapes philippinarum]|uniref:uncharacterized protein LOC132713085 isoform X1 n=1 Tax=Ruditapes philippinarum TaxID=129788 RepID=UPI00295AABA6|nr:uncharacterized protein LOC132713085 isoform X1 [Ruditapes philippinarum]
MAEIQEVQSQTLSENQKIKHARISYFSCNEISVLVAAYSKNKGLLEGTKIPNNVKNRIWEGIALKVSEAGNALRTTKEEKTKWFNLSRISKQTHSDFKQSFNKPGGGPPLNSPKVKDIIDLNTDSENFCGIDGGLETEICFDYITDNTVTSNEGCQIDSANMEAGNTSTVSDEVEVIHPENANVEIAQETKTDSSDMTSQNKRHQTCNENQKQKK